MRYIKYEKRSEPYYEELKSLKDTVVANEGTDKECIFVREEDTNSFRITSVSRIDFESKGYDASSLSNEDMKYIARKMGETYVGDGSFWTDIEFWAEEYELPRIVR